MNIVGIISEYNPFHNGHLHHINEIKALFKNNVIIICLLSSNFVQRGEPALVDKYARADMAISNGADMVLEYPTLFCCASAEAYADNAIYIFNNIGIIDCISYGSKSFENNDVKKISEILANETEHFKEILKHELAKGISFPKARENALSHFFMTLNDESESIAKTLKSSNDILAIEYEKALIRQKSKILTIPIERIGSDYNDPNLSERYSSATAIRKSILSHTDNISCISDNVPSSTHDILKNYSENMKFGYLDAF
ncbi:MAG: nucleotidyltransferase family protein, partial [Clostridia bacterium]